MARLTARYKEVARWEKVERAKAGLLIEWEAFDVSLREEGKILVRVRTKYNAAHKPEGQLRDTKSSGWIYDSDTGKSVEDFDKDLQEMGFTKVKGG